VLHFVYGFVSLSLSLFSSLLTMMAGWSLDWPSWDASARLQACQSPHLRVHEARLSGEKGCFGAVSTSKSTKERRIDYGEHWKYENSCGGETRAR